MRYLAHMGDSDGIVPVPSPVPTFTMLPMYQLREFAVEEHGLILAY
jgi:hypothetical protein